MYSSSSGSINLLLDEQVLHHIGDVCRQPPFLPQPNPIPQFPCLPYRHTLYLPAAFCAHTECQDVVVLLALYSTHQDLMEQQNDAIPAAAAAPGKSDGRGVR